MRSYAFGRLTCRLLAWRAIGIAVLGVIMVLVGSQRASAQDCGNWARPMLCEAELEATDADRRSDRLDQRSQLRLAPRAQLDLELLGRDQRGRRFPDDRVTLGYDDSGCRGVLEVEDRGRQGLRVTASAATGRCRLDVWVPGNLNFEWEIDVEIDPGSRITYTRNESEYVVGALYRAILGREADAAGGRSAIGEVQGGNLESLVASMLRSQEFNESRGGMTPEELLDRFYQGVFARPADTGGVREYLGLVRSGQYGNVLLRMLRSPEFERRLPG